MMDLQKEVAEFNLERGWEKDTAILKDLLLNICEEVGEAWNVIKWVDTEKQLQLIKENKIQFQDFIGDSLYLILKIAWLLDIDSEKELKETLIEYKKRFPVEEVRKAKHGNPLAGGIDKVEYKRS